MADNVSVIRVSQQYPPALQRRPRRHTPAQVSLRRKLLYSACIVAAIGGGFLAPAVLWQGLSWGDALPRAVAASLTYLIVFAIRDPLGWRRAASPDAARGK
jgi:hypothetical protein